MTTHETPAAPEPEATERYTPQLDTFDDIVRGVTMVESKRGQYVLASDYESLRTRLAAAEARVAELESAGKSACDDLLSCQEKLIATPSPRAISGEPARCSESKPMAAGHDCRDHAQSIGWQNDREIVQWFFCDSCRRQWHNYAMANDYGRRIESLWRNALNPSPEQAR